MLSRYKKDLDNHVLTQCSTPDSRWDVLQQAREDLVPTFQLKCTA